MRLKIDYTSQEWRQRAKEYRQEVAQMQAEKRQNLEYPIDPANPTFNEMRKASSTLAALAKNALETALQEKESATKFKLIRLPEFWEPIPGFDGYEASTYGRIRSPKKILKGSKNSSGYLMVTMYWGEKGKRQKRKYGVHELVALTFLGHELGGELHIDHINGLKEDNSESNLERVTRSENMQRYHKEKKRKVTKVKGGATFLGATSLDIVFQNQNAA